MNEPPRLRDDLDALTPEERALLEAMEPPAPPPGAKDRVAAAILERLAAEDDPADERPPAPVRRIG